MREANTDHRNDRKSENCCCERKRKTLCVVVISEDLYGDFEDLETGETHTGQTQDQDQAQVSTNPLLAC